MANSQSAKQPNGARQIFWFQFVTTPTADTLGTTLILHFDKRRYAFGRVSEGTQRACIQRGVGIKKLGNLFLTGETKWANNGGLIGMILTLSDVIQQDPEEDEGGRRRRLNIHGGPKLMHTLACARRFVFRTGMPIAVHESKATREQDPSLPDYTDDLVDVWSIPIRQRRGRAASVTIPKGRGQSPNTVGREQDLRKKTVTDMFDSDWRKDRLVESRFGDVKLPAMVWIRDPETKQLQSTFCTKVEDAPHISPDQIVQVRNPWPAALVEELPPADNLHRSVAMSYIVRGKPQRGTFDLKKAKELKIPPGPVYSQLANGEHLTLEDGRIITPEMVLGPTLPGSGMAILDVPHTGYLEDMELRLKELQVGQALEGVKIITWILGPGVLESTEFVSIVKHYDEVQHIISSPDSNPNHLSIDSSAASSIRLSEIRPECFLIPGHDNGVPPLVKEMQNIMPFLRAERDLKVQMPPKFKVQKEAVPPFLDIGQVKGSLRSTLRTLMPAPSQPVESADPYDDIKIFTLGTGSAAPSKYRNVSSNLVQIPELGNYLFDVGENTIGQLRRIFAVDELDAVLCDLRMIWISHLHADHHLGTVSIITAREGAVARRKAIDANFVEHELHVVSERNMLDYLSDYGSVEACDCVKLRILNSEITGTKGQVIDISETSLPIKELQTTRVSHCHGAQAISVTFSNGFKISYSGDCRPSAHFAKIGTKSDVLIHEATFDDGMEGDAKAKKHCTIGEALGVAHQMKAKNVILTHFSQRYQKLPVLTNINFADNVNFEEEGTDQLEADDPVGGEDAVESEQAASNTDPKSTIPTTNSESQSTQSSLLMQAALNMNVCVAFDLMRVTIPQIKDMHLYYPAIEKMFEIEQARSDAKREANRETNGNDQSTDKPSDKNKATPADEKYENINRSRRSNITKRNKKQREQQPTNGEEKQGSRSRSRSRSPPTAQDQTAQAQGKDQTVAQGNQGSQQTALLSSAPSSAAAVAHSTTHGISTDAPPPQTDDATAGDETKTSSSPHLTATAQQDATESEPARKKRRTNGV